MLRRAAAEGLALDGLSEHWHAADGRPRSGAAMAVPERPQGLVVGYGTPGRAATPRQLPCWDGRFGSERCGGGGVAADAAMARQRETVVGSCTIS